MPHDIQNYWRDLDDLRRVAGADNEGALSQAFAALLKARAAEHKLILSRNTRSPRPTARRSGRMARWWTGCGWCMAGGR